MPPKKKTIKSVESVVGAQKPGFSRLEVQTLDTDTQTEEIDLELVTCLQKLNSLKELPNEKFF